MDMSVFSVLLILLFFPVIGLGIFCLILYIKLALRSIKALDIYINEKTNTY